MKQTSQFLLLFFVLQNQFGFEQNERKSIFKLPISRTQRKLGILSTVGAAAGGAGLGAGAALLMGGNSAELQEQLDKLEREKLNLDSYETNYLIDRSNAIIGTSDTVVRCAKELDDLENESIQRTGCILAVLTKYSSQQAKRISAAIGVPRI